MTYEEKGKWVYMVTSLVGFLAYAGIILSELASKEVSEIAYAPLLLKVIGITITATIVIQIMIAISKPHEADKKDQRDKDINRYGDLMGGIILGIAMIIPFIMVLNNAPHFLIANTMYGAFVLSAVVSSAVKVVAYRRGI